MIKKIFTPATIAILFWGIGLLIINQYYYEYLRPYLYLSIIIALGCIVYDKIEKNKEE
ncbi:hypothetical protein GCM10022422_25450 [Flavobacterium ginsengisoli]|uniref:Group-specific protein n=1 Tax=Flavobacterium ginsengisoli TaxID=871694 RepID=A0ABP7FP75_9FLAO